MMTSALTENGGATMAEYIEREAALAVVKRTPYHATQIKNISAADVVERKEAAIGEKLKEAFGTIASYNGHEEWLWQLSDDLRSCEGSFTNPLPTKEWFTDRHALWMFLVVAFGDWGTSVRCGWIEELAAAADFIDEVTDRYAEWRAYDDLP